MALQAGIGNRLLAALPSADFNLLAPHLQKAAFGFNAVLVRTGDDFRHVYFPCSGAISFLVEMSDGQIVASTLMGSEGAVGALSILSPARSRSPVTATAYVAGTALHVPVSQLQRAFEQSAAIRRVLRFHFRTQLLQLQNVAACNAVHSVECRMARWLLDIHDRVGASRIQLTQEALAHLLGVRRTTVTLTMRKLRETGGIISEQRGVLEIDRTRLGTIACECYGLMRDRINRMYDEELPVGSPNIAHAQHSPS
ncbi:Crp/Fnr family transcriptional regulator [Bradyrhizobium arachidis]|uniref:Crp/Fnr family transcriptional regulator n=1 Tax=Bradyrhizobium arachidis TaxID=858423 RepID=A0AAE7NVP0_9BRAD|nr:Crp/Fnr family transcriptional regulator [Bradyrhizobium arachidis]QOZ71105.1 Crp/Fnr family transcriptional regulator [Bradyrhizobium arachidis]SFV19787.1 cAMP-binding domain of CRP or a regulatory subunit of cAMP-dependent protein kinases [Bradyrhizobium arachidis]